MRLTDVLNEDYINISLNGKNRDDCIKELIEKLANAETIKSTDTIFDAVLKEKKS